MAESSAKVKIYTPGNQYVGYFLNPEVEEFPENEYNLSGHFFDDQGKLVERLDFNPEALPYNADLSELAGAKHARLVRVYVQRGRQPVRMSGVGTAS